MDGPNENSGAADNRQAAPRIIFNFTKKFLLAAEWSGAPIWRKNPSTWVIWRDKLAQKLSRLHPWQLIRPNAYYTPLGGIFVEKIFTKQTKQVTFYWLC